MRLADRYRVLRRVGEGGGGGVWLVEDRLADDAVMVLKRLHPQAQHGLAQWLVNEFQIVAQLDLPTIARVHDFGLAHADAEDPGGPFFTRAFVDGAPLDEALAGAGAEAVRAALVSTAATLRALHRLGVVHGDLKPANLLVPTGSDKPVLIDFGLAHGALGAAARVRGGTLPFMPPERQARLFAGEALSPDPQADVYALGLSFRCVLAGSAEPPQVGAAPPDRVRDDEALFALWELCGRAAADDPGRRVASMDDLLAALGADPGDEAPGLRRVVLRPEGREHELGALLDAVARRLVQREAGAPAVLVVGEEGSGRSTLLRELAWRAQLRGVQTLTLDGGPGDGPVRRLRQGAAILSGTAVDASAPDGLATALRRAAAQGPVLVLADDLDHADPGVAALLRSIAYGCDAAEPLLVVASAEDAARVKGLEAAEVIALGPLEESAVSALCGQILGAVEPSVVAAVQRRTGGLPLAVTELLMGLAREGAVRPADVEQAEVSAGAAEVAARRVAALSPEALRAAATVAALGGEGTPEALRAAGVAVDGIAEARAAGVVRLRADGRVTAASVAVESALRAALPETTWSEVAGLAAEALASVGASVAARAWAWLRAGQWARAAGLATEAAEALRAEGLPRGGAGLLEALRRARPDAATGATTLLEAELLHEAGELAEAAALARSLVPAAGPVARRARLLLGRLLRAQGDTDGALATLEVLARDPEAEDDLAAEALTEQCRAEMPRGDYAAVRARALDAAARAKGQRERAAARALAGVAAVYAGDVAAGMGLLEEARAQFAALGLGREEATVIVYLAVARERAGDLEGARALHAQSLDRARAAGDLRGMVNARINLGHIAQRRGDLGAALEHGQASLRLAQRAGMRPAALYARLNTASQLVRIGCLDRARTELDAASRLAAETGAPDMAAAAALMRGVARARGGEVAEGLAEIEAAAQRFAALGQADDAADARLDAVEVLLDRGSSGDVSRATELLAAVRAVHPTLGDKEPRAQMLEGRAALGRGDARGALATLGGAVQAAESAGDWEVLTAALGGRAQAHAAMGAELHARRDRERALEVLEEKAGLLPPDLRGAFWSAPRRASLRAEAMGHGDAGEGAGAGLRSVMGGVLGLRTGMGAVSAPTLMASDERTVLLIELSRRLGEEDSLERVLQQAVRSAVELTGAERGALLLAGADGALAVRAREGGARGDGPDDAFSRSLAETVWIDGEPVVTLDARGDRRFADFRSVHALGVQAVAAVPIRFRGRVLGVLYVESRRRRVVWSPSDVALMTAFAEQAAIAVEHCRVVEELEARTHELERARAEIESLLASRTTELEATRSSLVRAQEALGQRFAPQGLVGQTPAMRRLFALIERLRDSDVSVVIEGESGTGKELVARALHHGGPRSKGPFVVVHCGAIPETLLESELFGHVRGAFTGADRDRKGLLASAHGGTLVLDEVSEMSPKMQVELLRVLQERKVRPVGAERDEAIDVRVVAAGNRSLQEMVAAGRFREDLYYRLAVVTLHIPPLRERVEDIPALAAQFLTDFATSQGGERKRLSREALARLMRAPWPGNVRQLRHALESATVLAERDVIEADALAVGDETRGASVAPPAAAMGPEVTVSPPGTSVRASPAAVRRAQERQRIVDGLEACNWNKVKAAEHLGMPRRTLYRRLKEYGLLD
jgi:serine/threonine-protein kinase PknK